MEYALELVRSAQQNSPDNVGPKENVYLVRSIHAVG